MKPLILSILLATALASCKKNNTMLCEQNVPGIAGSYKMTKFELVSYATGQAQDVTSTLTPCELSSVYDLRSDSTASYTEMISCSGSGTGTWELTEGGILITSMGMGNGTRIRGTSIVSWDCKELVLITHFPSVNYNNRYTLTRQ